MKLQKAMGVLQLVPEIKVDSAYLVQLDKNGNEISMTELKATKGRNVYNINTLVALFKSTRFKIYRGYFEETGCFDLVYDSKDNYANYELKMGM